MWRNDWSYEERDCDLLKTEYWRVDYLLSFHIKGLFYRRDWFFLSSSFWLDLLIRRLCFFFNSSERTLVFSSFNSYVVLQTILSLELSFLFSFIFFLCISLQHKKSFAVFLWDKWSQLKLTPHFIGHFNCLVFHFVINYFVSLKIRMMNKMA